MQPKQQEMRLCDCQCGQWFAPRKVNHRFINDAHKQKARRNRDRLAKQNSRVSTLKDRLPKFLRSAVKDFEHEGLTTLLIALSDGEQTRGLDFTSGLIVELVNAFDVAWKRGFEDGQSEKHYTPNLMEIESDTFAPVIEAVSL
jgi:uncharacterized C2H2 Zn-finger protein